MMRRSNIENRSTITGKSGAQKQGFRSFEEWKNKTRTGSDNNNNEIGNCACFALFLRSNPEMQMTGFAEN